jgi:16S rRNA (cytosine1402-N4)-methyltransferase
MKKPSEEHIPVLLNEVLSFVSEKSIPVFFEGTLGLGGHAEAILREHPEIGCYIATDQDELALSKAKDRLKEWESKIHYFHSNFKAVDQLMHRLHIDAFDAGLLDIGVSSMQLDTDDRGFSLRKDGPLDMRMDRSQSISAKDVINGYSEKELAQIFFELGEIRFSKPLAKLIVEERKKKIIETTADLTKLVEKIVGRQVSRTHPATQVFQAIRIEVNQELEVLKEGIKKCLRMLSRGGIFMVISFHSLEDRIVKELFKEASSPIKNERGKVIEDARFEILTKKPVVPSLKEVKQNPRSRSAKLRVIKRIIEE